MLSCQKHKLLTMRINTLLLTFLMLLLMGCVSSKNQASCSYKQINPLKTKDLHLAKSVSIDSLKGVVKWEEEGHEYRVETRSLTKIYLNNNPPILSAEQSVIYEKQKWIGFANKTLAKMGIQVSEVIFSIPHGNVLVFRAKEKDGRNRLVDCLISPFLAANNREAAYTDYNLYLSENMIEREVCEQRNKKTIVIVDHLRDRNQLGDLKVAYFMQDKSTLDYKKGRGNNFLYNISHDRLFESKSITYEYIRKHFTQISMSLQQSCRYKEFIPQNAKEEIPTTYLIQEN